MLYKTFTVTLSRVSIHRHPSGAEELLLELGPDGLPGQLHVGVLLSPSEPRDPPG